jgi:hypothetical protein
MNELQIAKELERAFELRSELYDLANKFVIEGNGDVAMYLHEACNCILKANNVLNGLPAVEPMDQMMQLMNDVTMRYLDKMDKRTWKE